MVMHQHFRSLTTRARECLLCPNAVRGTLHVILGHEIVRSLTVGKLPIEVDVVIDPDLIRPADVASGVVWFIICRHFGWTWRVMLLLRLRWT